MSWTPGIEPDCATCESSPVIEKVIVARKRDLGGFTVGRVLPAATHKLVGPFIFFDHMGPVDMPAGTGMDVRPHPHINLATVTYLFDGEIVHRDSLGSHQPICPGEINWMTAGRGIVHSERTGSERRAAGQRLHGIQLWVALPRAYEEVEPEFHHHAGPSLPELHKPGVRIRVLAGKAFGAESPVRVFSPLLYADVEMTPGSELALPNDYEERAVYVVAGTVTCGPERAGAMRMLVLAGGAAATVRAESSARVMLLGGERLDGERHIWWNFVSSSLERIERAKRDWKEERFAKVPGDEVERIPLPEPLG